MKAHAYRAPGTRWLRTDVRYMRKRELFRSSGEFLFAGVVCLALAIVVGTVAFAPEASRPANVVVSGAMFGLFILSGMGFAGSIYLCLRGAARSSDYNPEAVWQADQAQRAEDEDVE